MTAGRTRLKLFLDENVPVSVGKVLKEAGRIVIYFNDALLKGSPDQFVCAVAEANDAILIAVDSDMKRMARKKGIGQKRFRQLSLIKLSCREPTAALRIRQALGLIESEWELGGSPGERCIFIEIADGFIKTKR